MPRQLAAQLADHEVQTVHKMGWAGNAHRRRNRGGSICRMPRKGSRGGAPVGLSGPSGLSFLETQVVLNQGLEVGKKEIRIGMAPGPVEPGSPPARIFFSADRSGSSTPCVLPGEENETGSPTPGGER
jgi:hypothetical protein